MSEHNDMIAAMMMAGAPPARDLGFELAVMARIEQRRFARGVALHAILAAVMTLVLLALAPQIDWAAAMLANMNVWITAALALSFTAWTCWQSVRERNI